MTTAVATPLSEIAQFKFDVDTLLEKRRYFNERILPTLIEGKDYYVIKGKKSLGKAGAEKLAGLYNLVALFERDEATMKSFDHIRGLVAFICTLRRSDGSVAGQGRGCSSLTANDNDANKTIKMATKSAFIDGIIRSTGLSEIFTQDIDSMPMKNIQAYNETAKPSLIVSNVPLTQRGSIGPSSQITDTGVSDGMITLKQKKFLENLAYEHINGEDERDLFMSGLDSMTKEDATESISGFLMTKS